MPSSTPLNIAFVSHSSCGGSGSVAASLGIALVKRGHIVHFISDEVPFHLRATDSGIHCHTVPVTHYPAFRYPPYSLMLASKIVDVVTNYPIDVLHVHYALPHAISGILAYDSLPNPSFHLVTTLHGTDVSLVGQEPNLAPMMQYGINRSSKVTAVSNYLRDCAVKNFSVTRTIDVIHNFVDTDLFTTKPRTNAYAHIFPEDREVARIIHVSNFRSVKNIPQVIQCFARFRQCYPSHLVLVGDGPELAKALEYADTLGISSDILSLGDVRFLHDLLPHADIFLFPSYSESFGLALLEAMSCGVPSVSSNCGGICEVVVDGHTGFAHDPDDTGGMVESMKRLWTREDRMMFRSHARKRALDFSLPHAIDRYEEVYRRLP